MYVYDVFHGSSSRMSTRTYDPTCFVVSSKAVVLALGCHRNFRPSGDVKNIHQMAADAKVASLTEAITSGSLGSSASSVDLDGALRALWNTYNAEGCRWAFLLFHGGGASSATQPKKEYVNALVAGHFPFLDYDMLTFAFSRYLVEPPDRSYAVDVDAAFAVFVTDMAVRVVAPPARPSRRIRASSEGKYDSGPASKRPSLVPSSVPDSPELDAAVRRIILSMGDRQGLPASPSAPRSVPDPFVWWQASGDSATRGGPPSPPVSSPSTSGASVATPPVPPSSIPRGVGWAAPSPIPFGGPAPPPPIFGGPPLPLTTAQPSPVADSVFNGGASSAAPPPAVPSSAAYSIFGGSSSAPSSASSTSSPASATAQGSTPYARLLSRLRLFLESREYINVLFYSHVHRQKVSLSNTKSATTKVVLVGGQLQTTQDDGDGPPSRSTWSDFLDGFLFVVRAMLEIPSRRDEVGDRLAFYEFLTIDCAKMSNPIAYAETFMFEARRDRDWCANARANISLFLRFSDVSGSSSMAPPPPRLSQYPGRQQQQLPPPGQPRGRAAAVRPPAYPPGSAQTPAQASGPPPSQAPSRVPTMANPLGWCRSRVAKSAPACTRSSCMFRHTCPYCPGAPDHTAAVCSLAPQ